MNRTRATGEYTYTWTLYRDGQQVGAPYAQKIACDPKWGACQLPSDNRPLPSVSGKYQAKLKVAGKEGLSNAIVVEATPPCPPQEKGHLLHVTGLTSDGRFWHAIRFAKEFTWAPFNDVKIAAVDQYGAPGNIVDIDVAVVKGELHVAVVNDKGRIFHAIRHPYSWQAFREIHGHTGAPAAFDKVAVAEVNGELHLTGLTSGGGLWHTIRHAASWDQLRYVLQHTGDPGGLRALDMATVNGELHIAVVNKSGRVYHTIRHASSWDQLADVQTHTGTPGTFKAIAAATVGGELHIVAIAENGTIWHTIRHPSSWDKFGEATAHTTFPGRFERVSAGQSGGELHLVAVTENGGLFHTIRHASSWDKFGDVEQANAGERGTFRKVAIAGLYLP